MDDILNDVFSNDEDVENAHPNTTILHKEATAERMVEFSPNIQKANEVSKVENSNPNDYPVILHTEEATAERMFKFSPKIQKANDVSKVQGNLLIHLTSYALTFVVFLFLRRTRKSKNVR